MKFLRLIAAGVFLMLATQAYAQQPASGALQIGQGSALPKWLTMSADCALAATGAITCTKTNGASLGTMATQNASAVAITGGSITGMSAPMVSSDVATKQYVDSAASGLTAHTAVALATAAALPANTYNNGTSGVGATLTATSNAALTVDGTGVSTSQRILVKNESTAANNGIYTVTTAGNGSTAYVLTRATDANTPGTQDPTKIGAGTFVLVSGGSTLANTGWLVNSSVTTIGTSAINWAQFSAASGVASIGGMSGSITCGTGLLCTGGTISNAGVVSIGSQTGAVTCGTGITCAASAIGLTTNALTLGSTSMALGSTTSTINGALTFGGSLTLSSALRYGGVTLSNAVTGTGSMVLSNSPTTTSLSDTASVTAPTIQATGALRANSAVFFTGINATSGNAYICFITSNDSLSYNQPSCLPSDERFKTNITGASAGLLDVLRLRPVMFDWLDADDAGNGRQIGLIAQDVESVIPNLVATSRDSRTITLASGEKRLIEHPKTVDYERLVVPLINAVQTLTIICCVLFVLIVLLAFRQHRLSRRIRAVATV